MTAPHTVLDQLYVRMIGDDDSGSADHLRAGLRMARILVLDERIRHTGLSRMGVTPLVRSLVRSTAALDVVECRLERELMSCGVSGGHPPGYRTDIVAALGHLRQVRDALSEQR